MRTGRLATAITAAAVLLASAALATTTASAAMTASAATPGSALWTATHAGGTTHSIAADPGQGLVFTAGNSLVAYDASTGAKKWEAAGTFFTGSRAPGDGVAGDPAQAIAVGPSGNTVYVIRGLHRKGAGGSAFAYYTGAFNAVTGAREWVATYSGKTNLANGPTGITVSKSGDIFVTGTSPGTTSRDDDATVAYGSAGKQLWVARYNGPGNDEDLATAVTASPDGTKVFVTGSSVGKGYDYATIAYAASTGKALWTARYNDPANGADKAYAIAVSPDGTKVFVDGTTYQGHNMLTTVGYAAGTGKQLWAKTAGPVADDGSDTNYTLVASPAGGGTVIASGSTSANKLTSVGYASGTGAQKWTSTGPGQPLVLEGAALSSDGATMYLIGSTYSSGESSQTLTLALNAATGTQAWSTVMPQSGSATRTGTGAAVLGGSVYALAQDWTPPADPGGFTIAAYQG